MTCSEARATFTVSTTVASKAGSGTAGGEKDELATGVDTGGTTGTTESIVAFVDEASTSEATGASKESSKRPADMLLFVWRGEVSARKKKLRKYRQAIANDLKGQQASRQMQEVPLLG